MPVLQKGILQILLSEECMPTKVKPSNSWGSADIVGPKAALDHLPSGKVLQRTQPCSKHSSSVCRQWPLWCPPQAVGMESDGAAMGEVSSLNNSIQYHISCAKTYFYECIACFCSPCLFLTHPENREQG